MGESSIFEGLSQRTLDEHQRIHFYIERLSRALRSLPTEGTDVEPLRRLGAEIESLIERLDEHFSGEESGGLYQAVADALPESAAEVRHLCDQHARIREILEMAAIHAERGSAEDVAPLRDDLQGFLEIMSEHERREEDLLRRALAVDSD